MMNTHTNDEPTTLAVRRFASLEEATNAGLWDAALLAKSLPPEHAERLSRYLEVAARELSRRAAERRFAEFREAAVSQPKPKNRPEKPQGMTLRDLLEAL